MTEVLTLPHCPQREKKIFPYVGAYRCRCFKKEETYSITTWTGQKEKHTIYGVTWVKFLQNLGKAIEACPVIKRLILMQYKLHLLCSLVQFKQNGTHQGKPFGDCEWSIQLIYNIQNIYNIYNIQNIYNIHKMLSAMSQFHNNMIG